MFDFGFMEIMLICVIALVVLGPEKLPALVRTVGQWICLLYTSPSPRDS